MNYRYLDLIIHRYLVSKPSSKPRIPKSLKSLIEEFPEAREILDGRCPWCGRRFSRGRSIARHLSPNRRLSSCPFMYLQLLKIISNSYKDIEKVWNYKRRRYYVRSLGIRFKTFEEAVEAVLKVFNQGKNNFHL